MKLRDYFESQKQIRPSSFDKMNIYQKFDNKKQRKSIFAKFSFYAKVGVLTVLFVFVIMSLYTPFYNPAQNDAMLTQVGTGGVFVGQQDRSQNKVRAEAIGRIIETIGDFKIISNGEEFQSDTINDNDTVMLMSGSSIRFEVNSGAKARIDGPAKFSLQSIQKEDEQVFFLNLIYGKYFEIKSEEKDNLVIKTQNLELEQKNVGEKLDLKIVSQGDKQILENNGGELIVKQTSNNKKTISSIKTNQKAEIDDNLKILAEVKKIEKDLKDKNISDSYAFTGNSGETLSLNVDQLSGDMKKALTPEAFESLKQVLYPTFLNNDMQDLTQSYLKGDREGFEISYKKYISRLEKLYKLFELDVDSQIITQKVSDSNNINIDDLILMTDQLLGKIQKKYFIPDQYTKRLQKMLNILQLLDRNGFGTHEKAIDFDDIITKLGVDKNYFVIN